MSKEELMSKMLAQVKRSPPQSPASVMAEAEKMNSARKRSKDKPSPTSARSKELKTHEVKITEVGEEDEETKRTKKNKEAEI